MTACLHVGTGDWYRLELASGGVALHSMGTTNMATHEVFRFQYRNKFSGVFQISARWATLEEIEFLGCEPIGTSATAGDADMDPNFPGMTRPDFSPRQDVSAATEVAQPPRE
jgi:hypothetical protein